MRKFLQLDMARCGWGRFNGVSLLSIATLVLLASCFIWRVGVEGSVTKFGSSVTLDYVSLTDNGRQRPVENEVNTTKWVVGGVTECSQLPAGCSCSDDRAVKAISVVCGCRDGNEVVNLNQGGSIPRLFQFLSWEVKGCSKVVVHQNFLSGIFNSGSELRLLLKFSDVTYLVIHESAFAVADSGSFSHETTVEFNNCDIDTVPPKAFPSYLRLLKFENCRIGTLSAGFIQSLQIDTISFINSTIMDVQPDAFYHKSMINALLAQNSTFKQIRREAVASGIQHLNWTDTSIDRVDELGLSGLIVNVYLVRCTLSDVQPQGFFVKTWSVVKFVNNSFDKVSHRGIDLTQSETNGGSDTSAYIVGNSWRHVEKDFVVTGMRENSFATIESNTFLQSCTCGSTFLSLLSLNESKSWFLDQLFESSRCPLDEKDKHCFSSENGTNDGFVSYGELNLLCSPEMYMCTSEVNEMHVNPKLPNRLQLLAFFIGAFVLFMVVSLLLTLMVYMIKKQRPRKQDTNGDLSSDVPRKEFVKSLNPDPYGHSPVAPKMTKTPSMPSRLAANLEDVEMEDKGVQTLPTELSADIIEGLREKLSKPDSFWDAKETIDHLYDLIHVRDQAAISSPPDVTCNDNSSDSAVEQIGGGRNKSTDSLKPLVTPRRNIKVQPVDRSPNRRSMSTFAQLASSPTKKVAVGVGPNNPSPIYSELSAVNRQSRHLPSPTTPPPLPTSSPPTMLCEYTEPRDFQTHIYAELMSVAATSNHDPYGGGANGIDIVGQSPTKCPMAGFDKNYPSQTSSVILNSPQHNVSKNLNDLNVDYNKTSGEGGGYNSSTPNNIIPDPNIPPSTPNKRPLPSIPPKPVSTSIP